MWNSKEDQDIFFPNRNHPQQNKRKMKIQCKTKTKKKKNEKRTEKYSKTKLFLYFRIYDAPK